MEDNQCIRRKANTYFFIKVAINLFLLLLGTVLIAFFLRHIQRQSALKKHQITSNTVLSESIKTLRENANDLLYLTEVFHDGNQDTVNNLQVLLNSGLFDSLASVEKETHFELLADMIHRSGMDHLFVLNQEGIVLFSSMPEYDHGNLVQQGLLSEENLGKLLRGTVREDGRIVPVEENNIFGSFFYYSARIPYYGHDYWLVLGAEASLLDLQISSLKDVSTALGRAKIPNGGFLFAVSLKDQSFLFLNNGRENLTGENALEVGLSKAALQDGYSGVETIRGIRYHCVTQAYDEDTVVCAVANTSTIYSNDWYVLLWSITGFVLVMLLCLVYAIIVRNDFVRNAIETRKKIFEGKNNTIIFDISVFEKIFPLMITGVFLIFGISFYTQTLLEISEGIERSSVALSDITARYHESKEIRNVIEKYYSDRFLSKAKLIAYLLEEEPSFLNQPSTKYYSVYGEDGTKRYLNDDEGNRLKAVASSEFLQELCNENDLETICVFDENGRVIATNNSHWYNIISHNESDPSYAFLQVLDGKKEAYVQEVNTNDNGSSVLYIGVEFSYYTTVDESGSTVYVSHHDFTKYLDHAETMHPITPHHSLLTIGLKSELFDTLIAFTKSNYVLSSDILEDGFFLLFDTSPDHHCLYSPKEANIGMTAAELYISEKAFTSTNYYGFTIINGTKYFVCSQYTDGSFVLMATPKYSMFQARTRIALITMLTSLILILILSSTVTFTTWEEEELYAKMSEDGAHQGFNSTIFRIILPSGRSSSTVKAAARWNDKWTPWSDRSPEQKLMLLIKTICGILILYVAISVIGAKSLFSENSIFRYILSGDWDRGLNIFAFSACVLVMIFVTIGVSLLRILVYFLTSLLGTHSATIGHLLLSVTRYGGAIGAIFYCLYLLGMDSKSLMASGGILSLIIGLGAQSLIKDILAGIFIVFEGEFRVGDIVTIDECRGTVVDIGLRTTKILVMGGNIKIYNNSDISGVLNMTKEASVAVCSISIEYGQDIDYVEAVLKRDLPLLREKNPQIIKDPVYAGISALADSGVQLMILCFCNEKDIMNVKRYMNKEILKIFYRNGINIPFPNMTISQLNSEGRKTMSDYQDRPSHGPSKRERSETILVSDHGQNMNDALQMTESWSIQKGIDHKQSLHLRLLAEELFGIQRGIAKDVEASYWLETFDSRYELHLRFRPIMTKEMRKQLLAVSTSGKNEAAKGFIGKLQDMISAKMLPSESSLTNLKSDLMEGVWSANSIGVTDATYEWLMTEYRSEIEGHRKESLEAKAAWDELEKSIVAKVADDVKISIKRYTVEIVIFKTFLDNNQ